MTAVGLGHQGSQAVGSGFESLPCQKALRFSSKNFRNPKLVKYYKNSPTKIFGTVTQKIFDGKSRHNPLLSKFFRYPKLMKH